MPCDHGQPYTQSKGVVIKFTEEAELREVSLMVSVKYDYSHNDTMWLSTYVSIAIELNQKIELDIWKIKSIKYQIPRMGFYEFERETEEGVG